MVAHMIMPMTFTDAVARPQDCFSLPDATRYLNSAGQALRLRSVQAAGETALRNSATPWRLSMSDWLQRPERVRASAARLLGVSADCLALQGSVAYGMRLAAELLPLSRGQTVLVLADEHPSCTAAWRAACERQGAHLLPLRSTVGQSRADTVMNAIDHRCAVLALPACHWHDGGQLDLARIAQRARDVGAALLIDATQAWGVLPIDVSALDPDMVVAAGHKWLLGTPGLAYAYIAPRHHAAEPLEQYAFARAGGETFPAVDADPLRYRDGARRFDAAGIYNSLSLAMAEPALRQLAFWHAEALRSHLGMWQDVLRSALHDHGLDRYWRHADSPHISSLDTGRDTAQLAARLHDQGFIVAARGDALRISPHIHSSSADAEALAVTLSRCMD
jgi:selenocysteine lyase/cysteine desulfurase